MSMSRYGTATIIIATATPVAYNPYQLHILKWSGDVSRQRIRLTKQILFSHGYQQLQTKTFLLYNVYICN